MASHPGRAEATGTAFSCSVAQVGASDVSTLQRLFRSGVDETIAHGFSDG